jgi:hypothetical protein
MNYIKNDLNKLILESMKAGEKLKTEAFRAIKTAFMNWETAKENVGKELDEQVELQILRKMVASYKDAADQCNDGKHDALVQENLEYAKIIESYLPVAATEDQVLAKLISICNVEHIACEKRNMGVLIKKIKEALPTADGKMVADVVKKNVA